MTKEPIMIDGVDVNECEYNNKGFCNCVGHLLGEYDRKPLAQGIYCENNPNCYYKQLKRKEKECEKLKIDNKEQKRQLRVRANILKLTNEKNNELKQVLTEIKKIAEDECKNCIVKLLGEDEINCKRCYKTKILQKYEVLDAN